MMVGRPQTGPASRWPGSVVVGAGVAGLSAALELGEAVVLVDVGAGAAARARGPRGAWPRPSAPADTTRPCTPIDTVSACRAGLVDELVARRGRRGGPGAVAWLRALGARFDRDADGRLVLGREAGHRPAGSCTPTATPPAPSWLRALTVAVQAEPAIQAGARHHRASISSASDDRVVGVLARRRRDGALVLPTWPAPWSCWPPAGTATCSRRPPTRPRSWATALAMAARAGVAVADARVGAVPPHGAGRAGADPLPLLTEALRGEGAVLVDEDGVRFMVGRRPRRASSPPATWWPGPTTGSCTPGTSAVPRRPGRGG